MNLVETEILVRLLNQATDTLQVLDRRSNGALPPVDLNTYRSLLWSCRESNNTSARIYVDMLKPIVRDLQVKEQLTEVIRTQLHEYIHDDQIQSAVFAIVGGAANGFNLDDLLNHWMEIAIARGSTYAANAFLEGLNDPNVRYQKMTLLRGLRTDREITVSDGIRLVPLPNNPLHFQITCRD